MSAEVDNRIVEMQFNNAQFEKGVSESMSTLDKLKAALKFDGVASGFKKISDAANNCNVSTLGVAVEGVATKFSALEIAAQQAIRNITTDVQNAVKNFVKSVSIDQLTAGWSKFEEITNSSGTLVAQGFTNSQVEDVLNQLNWFTDETSYNLTDMVSNIGKFTASGLGLEESATAMEGIATWAALSGQNATKASAAMYQLSQAMSKGALKYDDWKSIQNAGMDTQEFRENAAEAAVAVGALTKAGEDMYTTLSGKTLTLNELFSSDYMSKQAWFTKDAMMEVFNQYSAAVDGIYEITEQTFSNKQGKQIKLYATEVLEARDAFEESGDAFKEYCDNLNLSDEAADSLKTLVEGIDEFGLKAFKAAQEARSWTDVVASVKDAVSTGWMNTYKLIVGDYEQAKELFSSLASTLYDVFAEGGNRRNEILSAWNELGGRDDLLKLFNGLVDLFMTTRDTIKDWWHEVFPEKTAYEVGQHIYETIKKFKEFVQTLKISDRALYNFKSIVEAVSMTAKTFKQAISYVLSTMLGFKSSANNLGGSLLEIVGIIARVIVAFNKWLQSSELIQKALSVLSKVAQVINFSLAVVFSLISKGLQKIQSNVKKVNKNQNKTSIWVTILNNLKKALKALGTAVLIAVGAIAKFVSYVANSKIVQTIKTGFVAAIAAIGTAFQNLGPTLLKAWIAIKNFFSNFKQNIKNFSISNLIDSISKAISNTIAWIREKLNGTKIGEILDNLCEHMKALTPLFEDAKNKAKDFFDNLSFGKVAAFAFTAVLIILMKNLADMAQKFGTMASTVTGFMNNTSALLKAAVKKTMPFLQFAEAVGIMAASLYLLKDVDSQKLKDIAHVIGVLTVTMIGATVAIGLLQKVMTKFSKTDKGIDFQSIGADYLALAGAVLMIAFALKKIEKFDFNATAGQIAVIGAIMLELGIVATIVGKWQKGGSFRGAATIVALGFSLKLILESLSNLQQFNFSQIMDGLVKIGVVLAAFGAMLAGLGTVGIGGGLTLVIIAGVLALFRKSILEVLEGTADELQAMAPKLNNFINSLDLVESSLIGIIAAASVAAIGFSFVTKGLKNVAKTILSFGIFIGVLAGVATMISKFADSGTSMMAGLVPVTAFLVILMGITFALGKLSSADQDKNIKAARKVLTSLGLVIAEMVLLCYLAEDIDSGALEKLGKIVAWITITTSVIIAVENLTKAVEAAAGSKALKAGGSTKGSLAAIVALVSVVLGVLVALSVMISMGAWPAVVTAAVAIIGAMITVMVAIKALGKAAEKINSVKLTITLGTLTVCIGLLAGIAYEIQRNNVEWKALGQAGALAGGLTLLTWIMSLISKMGSGIKWSDIAKVSAGIGIFEVALLGLTHIVKKANEAVSEWKVAASSIGSMTATLGVLTGFIVAFGAVGALLVSQAEILVGAIIGIVMMQLAIGSLTILLAAIRVTLTDWSITADMIGSVAALLGVLTGFGLVFSVLGLLAAPIALASLALKLMVSVLSVLATAMSYMIDVASKVQSIDSNAVANGLITLGKGILSFSSSIFASSVLLGVGLIIFTAITAVLAIFAPMAILAGVGFAAVGAGLLVLAAGINAVKTAAVGFTEFIGTLFGKAKEDGGYVAEGFADGIGSEESKSLISNAVSGLASLVSLVWRTLLQIESPSRVAINDGAYVAQGYAQGIGSEESKAEVSAATAALVNETESRLAEVPTAAKEAGSEAVDNLSQDWNKVPDTIKYEINKARGNVQTLEYTTAQSSSNMKTTIVNGLSKVREALVKTLGESNVLVTALDTLTGAVDDFDFSADGLLTTIAKATGMEDLVETVQDLTGEVEDGTSVLDEYASSVSSVGTSATETKSALEEMTDSLADSLDLFSEFSAGDEITPDQMLTNMNSQISAIANWGNMMALLAARGMDQGLLQELGELGTAGYAKVQAFVNMTDEQLSQANALYTQSLAFPEYVANEVQASYAYAGQMASQGFSNALDPTLAIVPAQQIGNTAVETLKNVLGIHSPSTVMHEIGANCMAGLLNAWKEGHISIRNRVELLCAMVKLKLSFGLSYSKGYDIGNNLVSGLANGIGENGSRAIDAAAWVAAQAYARACNVLGVESPSKKFYEIGMYTDMGFANGINKYSNLVTNASGGLGETAINSVRSAIQKVSAVINSDIDTSPTIRPTLDLSSIRAGAQEIGSMFNNNKYGVSVNGSASENQNKGGSSSGMTFVQNNYSPKALSREEIYRQTRNQFSALKGQIAHA